MRVLFIHQNFPGQFLHLAQALKRKPGVELLAVTHDGNRRAPFIPTRVYAFEAKPLHGLVALDHYAQRVARGMAVARLLESLAAEGFAPDLVIGHGGWGETLFVKDVWPKARLILHAEFYYAAEGADLGFDREFASSADRALDARMRVRLRNTAMLQALADADRGVAPTVWQASRFPEELRRRISVLHEGIDTDVVRPDPSATLALKRDGLALRPGAELITFVNRNLEPYRGYHVFMRALPLILAARPKARALIIGGDEVSYGPAPPKGRSWKEIFLAEEKARLDMSRVHFVGKVPYPSYLRVLQVSAAHVYLTYPFVLSWSMLEAMSAGALVIASATPPVEEVIETGRNGLTFPFFDHEALAARVIEALAHPERFAELRRHARRTIVERYDLTRHCLPRWLRLVAEVMA
jgi:glycosyltransferase involved in cell wall biosynthesis